MKINMTSLAFNLDNDGTTNKINVSLTGYNNMETFNANVSIVAEDLKEGETLDDLSKKQVETYAKTKCVGWFK